MIQSVCECFLVSPPCTLLPPTGNGEGPDQVRFPQRKHHRLGVRVWRGLSRGGEQERRKHGEVPVREQAGAMLAVRLPISLIPFDFDPPPPLLGR